MNKKRFRLLVFLMSVSLIGIILVQLYWINTSLKKSEEEFKLHVQQVIGRVAERINEKEFYSFYKKYNAIKDSIGKEPEEKTLKEFFFMERNKKTNETIIYTSSLVSQDYGINGSFFDKNADTIKVGNILANRKTEIYAGTPLDNNSVELNRKPDITIEKTMM